jgi:hypothetical protein
VTDCNNVSWCAFISAKSILTSTETLLDLCSINYLFFLDCRNLWHFLSDKLTLEVLTALMAVKGRVRLVFFKTRVTSATVGFKFWVEVGGYACVVVLAESFLGPLVLGVKHVRTDDIVLSCLVLTTYDFLLLAHYAVLLVPALSLNFLQYCLA